MLEENNANKGEGDCVDRNDCYAVWFINIITGLDMKILYAHAKMDQEIHTLAKNFKRTRDGASILVQQHCFFLVTR